MPTQIQQLQDQIASVENDIQIIKKIIRLCNQKKEEKDQKNEQEKMNELEGLLDKI